MTDSEPEIKALEQKITCLQKKLNELKWRAHRQKIVAEFIEGGCEACNNPDRNLNIPDRSESCRRCIRNTFCEWTSTSGEKPYAKENLR